MIFVLIGTDGPEGQAKRKIHREAHLKRLEELSSQGNLILAGPFEDKTGSLVVFKADSLEAAKAWAAQDPYALHGVFEKHEVRPFIQVFP